MPIDRRQALLLATGTPFLRPLPELRSQGSPPPSGILAVVSIDTGSVAVLDARSGARLHRISIGGGPHEIARIPGTRRALVPDYFGLRPGRTLHVVDLAKGSLESSFELLDPAPAEPGSAEVAGARRPFGQPHGVCAYGPDRALVTSEARSALLVVEHREGRVERAIPTHARLSHMVLLARDGRRAFVSNKTDGNLSVLDLEAGRFLRHVDTGAGAQGMALHPERPELWVANITDDSLTILDETSLEVLGTHRVHDYPVRLAFTPEGRWCLATNYGGGSVSLLDGETGKPLRELELPPVPIPDGEDGALGDRTEDAREAQRRARFGQSPLPVGLSLHPTGECAYVSCTRSNRIERLALGPTPEDAHWMEAWEGVVHPDGSLFIP